MVKIEWGTKRACQNCAAKFYDLRRTPIVCPKCDTVFELATTTRRSRKSSPIDDLKVLPFSEEELLNSEADTADDLVDAGLIEEDDDLDNDLDGVVDVIPDEDHDR